LRLYKYNSLLKTDPSLFVSVTLRSRVYDRSLLLSKASTLSGTGFIFAGKDHPMTPLKEKVATDSTMN